MVGGRSDVEEIHYSELSAASLDGACGGDVKECHNTL